MKKAFITIINLIFLAMTINNINASSKIRTEDLDLDYFEQTVIGQLRDAYTWAGVLERVMAEDGYVPPIRPKEELRQAFAKLGAGDIRYRL